MRKRRTKDPYPLEGGGVGAMRDSDSMREVHMYLPSPATEPTDNESWSTDRVKAKGFDPPSCNVARSI